jgi:hypothetical protein
MKMRMTAALAALLCLPVLCSPGLTAELVNEQTTSAIAISKDTAGFHVRNTSRSWVYNHFVAATVEAASTAAMIRQLILVEKTETLHESDDSEPQREPGQIKVTVYPLGTAGKGAPNITLNMIGDDVSVEKSRLIIRRDGCCAERPTKAVYSLESGKYLFNATRDKWTTLGAKGGFAMTRVAAVHMAPTKADKELFKGHERGAAIISYTSPTMPIQRLMLLVPPGTDSGSAPLADGKYGFATGRIMSASSGDRVKENKTYARVRNRSCRRPHKVAEAEHASMHLIPPEFPPTRNFRAILPL